MKGATEGEMRPPCTGPWAGQGCPLLVGSGHGLRARCTHMQACMWHVWWHVCLGAGGKLGHQRRAGSPVGSLLDRNKVLLNREAHKRPRS